MLRRIAIILATSLACAPERGPTFAGEYEVTYASWTCRHDHPDGVPYGVRAYLEPITIDELDDGWFSLTLPMPPCDLTWIADGDELSMHMDDCIIDSPPTADFEAFSVVYSAGSGVALWNEGRVEITAEAGRRYTSVPNELPEWWDVPGSCHAEYLLEPTTLPAER